MTTAKITQAQKKLLCQAESLHHTLVTDSLSNDTAVQAAYHTLCVVADLVGFLKLERWLFSPSMHRLNELIKEQEAGAREVARSSRWQLGGGYLMSKSIITEHTGVFYVGNDPNPYDFHEDALKAASLMDNPDDFVPCKGYERESIEDKLDKLRTAIYEENLTSSDIDIRLADIQVQLKVETDNETELVWLGWHEDLK